MKIVFGTEKMEALSQKLLLAFFNYVEGTELKNRRVSVEVDQRPTPYPGNSETIFGIKDVDSDAVWSVVVRHADNMTCSNWSNTRGTVANLPEHLKGFPGNYNATSLKIKVNPIIDYEQAPAAVQHLMDSFMTDIEDKKFDALEAALRAIGYDLVTDIGGEVVGVREVGNTVE